ncbi:hypothetical protein T265_10479 [Opisthorchis viverrini]|uniref:Uncharacterized protein n=1 Tax=Opisthorchis viverrini TaxID=6198 RepID=A0A075A147_OPIVI|nr:hypothetical protein T265_10479 [Opisthorchis viverrini]KER21119.1 hypothetical protein T265_10479 [Opisthorchis viverrini]
MQETGRTTGPPAGSRPHSNGTILSVTTESPAAFPTVMRILKMTWHVSQSEKIKESCSTLSAPVTTRRRHEGCDTAPSPKPRQGKLRGRGRVTEDAYDRHNPNWICFLNGTQFKLKGVYFHQAENYHRNNAEDVRCERESLENNYDVTRSPRTSGVWSSNPGTAIGYTLLMSSNSSETRVKCFTSFGVDPPE